MYEKKIDILWALRNLTRFFVYNFVRDSLVRRSGRTKVAPLKFWMNEKVVYSKTREGPIIKSVIRAASEEAQEKPKRKPRRESKPLTVRPQRAAKEKKDKDKAKGKEDEQEDGEESGQDRTLKEDNHDSMDVDEDQAESSTGFREDPKVTADIIVFGSDDVVSKGKTHGPLWLCFVLVGLSHGTHGTSRLILLILFSFSGLRTACVLAS